MSTEEKQLQKPRPCPFCGSEPWLETEQRGQFYSTGESRVYYWYVCHTCDIKTIEFSNQSDLIKMWNARKGDYFNDYQELQRGVINLKEIISGLEKEKHENKDLIESLNNTIEEDGDHLRELEEKIAKLERQIEILNSAKTGPGYETLTLEPGVTYEMTFENGRLLKSRIK